MYGEKSIIQISVFCILIFSCAPKEEKQSYEKRQTSHADSIEISLLQFDSGWGYNILINNKLYIHQPHIPAVSGNQLFQSKEDAEHTANVMVNKIRNNEMPPSVSVQELESLGVKFNK